MKKWLVLAACIPAYALADAPVCDPVPREVQEAGAELSGRLAPKIAAGQFAAAEQELGDKVVQVEAGTYSDLQMLRDFEAARLGGYALEPQLTRWVAEAPRSFVARMVKASFHISVGYARRGGDLASKTAREQFDAMEAEFMKAAEDLRVAMALRPQSALPHAVMLQIAQAMGGSQSVEGILLEAERVAPRNVAARRYAIPALEPRWGGSFAQQDRLLQRAEAAGLPPAQLRYLRYQVQMSRGSQAEGFDKNGAQALVHYRAAAELCPDSRAWRVIAETATSQKQWQLVRQAADRHLAMKPSDARILFLRAFATEGLGDQAAALADYEAASDLGNPQAQALYGWRLAKGIGVPRNLARGRRLLQAAALGGSANAAASLEQLEKEEQAGRR